MWGNRQLVSEPWGCRRGAPGSDSILSTPQVSTHGYSQNQILVWKYPSLTQVAKLTGHSYRVLYLVSLRWQVLDLASTTLGRQGADPERSLPPGPVEASPGQPPSLA